MKNKFITIFLIFLFNISSFNVAITDEFTFEVTDLEIIENGTIYKGNNRGKITTNNQIELISDNFEYLKVINSLEANGNVEVRDIRNDIIINANKIFYLKNEEKIYTIGKTLINVSNKYNIEGSDFTFLKNEMILSSNRKATITDNILNIYKLDQFQYSINQEILKGKNTNFTRNEKENKVDRYFFETAFFNLKENTFIGKDFKGNFHKTLFDNKENDPRFTAVSGNGDEYNTYYNKGVFTTCKKTDKCPPWKMSASKIHHDKTKKEIIYKNAWLELYDFPVAYFPKFFHPDPSVKRRSGLLRPERADHTNLGESFYMPYFLVISDDKDLTIKPRFFNDNKYILHNEYRQLTRNSLTMIDSSILYGYKANRKDKDSTRSHFFANSKIDLGLEKYLKSSLQINYEKASNDYYLRVFDFLRSPLLIGKENDVLESSINLILDHKNYDFTSSVSMYETLSGPNSDRFQYVLPSYNFSKNFNLEEIKGSFNFNSSGSHSIKETNISSSSVSNDLSFSAYSTTWDSGLNGKFEAFVKNINTMSDKNVKYKTTPQSEAMTAYSYNVTMPFRKNNENSINTLSPKLSFRFSPHEMKNNSGADRRINIDNVFTTNRLGLGDSFETGESLTLGLGFVKEKVSTQNQITKIEEYFNFKLATVLRFNEEKFIPVNSTIDKKTSNIFGRANFKPNEITSLGYNFSLTDDMGKLEYNSINLAFNFDNFSTNFKYLEERGIIGRANVVSNTTSYNFNEENSIIFKTRRNRLLNLTEYYDLVYEYKNDCLIADIKYRKDYYSSGIIVPKEELFFSITIVPFYTYSPDKMILKKDRID